MNEPGRDIEALLRALGKGRSKVRKADALAKSLGTPKERTQFPIREMARRLNQQGHPVVSCHSGFYLAETKEELDDYISNLQSRMDAIGSRIKILKRIRRRIG